MTSGLLPALPGWPLQPSVGAGLQAPANLVSETVDDENIKLTFDVLPGVAGYEERHSLAGLDSWSTPTSITSGASVSLPVAGVLYDFQVRVIGGPWSEISTSPTLVTNLLTNPDFDSNDLTGWDNDSTGTGTAIASTGAAVLTGTNSANRGRISQAITPFEIGEPYRLHVRRKAGSGTWNAAVEVTKNAADGPLVLVSQTINDVAAQFVAAATAYRLRLENASTGGSATFDDLVMHGITPRSPQSPYSPRPQIFLDLDIDSDIDDVLDLVLLMALEHAGLCDIIGLCVSSANAKAAPCALGIADYYGRGDVDIGVNTSDSGSSTSLYDATIAASFAPSGKGDASDFENGITETYRRQLAAARDNSVSIVTTGGGSSLAALLKTQPDAYSDFDGHELVQAKVREVIPVAGYWPSGSAISDMNATKADFDYIFKNLTGPPILLCGIELGDTVETGGGGTITGLPSGNPMRQAWELYQGGSDPNDTRPAWGQLGILAAVFGLSGYFEVLDTGTAAVNQSTGATTFDNSIDSGHAYLGKLESDANFVSLINPLIGVDSFS